jgi:heat shock protein HslJ
MKPVFLATLSVTALLLAGCSTPSSPVSALEGPTWVLRDIDDASIMDGSYADLTIGADGSFHGNASCNGYGGKASVGRETITFGPVISTKMACTPSGTMQQEAHFLNAFDRVAHWHVAGRALSFLDADGKTVLYFESHGR